MKSFKAILLLPLIGFLTNPVPAYSNQSGYTKFDQRIERQHKRIKNGVRKDLLTKKEARKLRKQHRFIKKLNRYFQNDGQLDRFERRTLQRELDLASQRIYRLKHNDKYRKDGSHDHGYDNNYSHYNKNKDRKHRRAVIVDKRHYH